MRIDSLRFIAEIEQDHEIHLGCGPLLKRLEEESKGSLILPSVPSNSPPDVPRAILKTSDTVLALCWSRIELNVTPPTQIRENYNACMDLLHSRLQEFFFPVFDIVDGYRWSGLITVHLYPEASKSIPDALAPIFDHLLSIDRGGRTLGSFNLQYGFIEEGHNKTFSISGYENRDLLVARDLELKNKFIPIEALPLNEAGVQLVLDINNKVQLTNDLKGDLERTTQIHKKVFESYFDELGINFDNEGKS